MEITEEKLALFDNAEKCLLFSSGMAAISNTCLTFLEPGDTILYTNPVYGGTSAFFQNIFRNDIWISHHLVIGNDRPVIHGNKRNILVGSLGTNPTH